MQRLFTTLIFLSTTVLLIAQGLFDPAIHTAVPVGMVDSPPFESVEGYGNGANTNLPWMNACGVMLNDWYTKAIIIYTSGPTPMTWL